MGESYCGLRPGIGRPRGLLRAYQFPRSRKPPRSHRPRPSLQLTPQPPPYLRPPPPRPRPAGSPNASTACPPGRRLPEPRWNGRLRLADRKSTACAPDSTGNHSAARGISVPVTPGQQYDVSIAMRTGGEYWTCFRTEALWRDGSTPWKTISWVRHRAAADPEVRWVLRPGSQFDPTGARPMSATSLPHRMQSQLRVAAGGLNNSRRSNCPGTTLNVDPALARRPPHADSHPALSRRQQRRQGRRTGPVRVLTRLARPAGNRVRAVSMTRPGNREASYGS